MYRYFTRSSPKDLATLQCIVYLQGIVLRTMLLYKASSFTRNIPKILYRYLQGIVLRVYIVIYKDLSKDLATL